MNVVAVPFVIGLGVAEGAGAQAGADPDDENHSGSVCHSMINGLMQWLNRHQSEQ